MLKISSFVLLMFSSAYSCAQVSVGLGVGQSSYDWNTNDFGRGDAFELKSGYHFTKYFGVAFTYKDLGESQGREFDLSTKGFEFALGATLPIHNYFYLYGELGYMDYKTRLQADSAIFTVGHYFEIDGPIVQRVDKFEMEGKDLTASLGLSLQINRFATVYLEFSRYDFDQDASNVMVGVGYSL